MTSFFRLARIPMPMITVFGGAKEHRTKNYYQQAYDLSRRFAENGISIATGGGPGIMVAANCGAYSVKEKENSARTIGIAVDGVDEDFINPCTDLLRVDYFFMRKWLLIRYSVGFVVFPGGIGTIDELFELLNLIKHHRVPELPIVLIGTEYWKPLLDLLHNSALKSGLIDERLTKLFMVTDDLDEAFSVVHESCKGYLEE